MMPLTDELKNAEYAIAGRILQGDWAAVVAAGVENAEQFYSSAAQEVYKIAKAHGGDAAATICALAGRELDGGKADDVRQEMENAGDTSAAIEGYARIVLDSWRTREAARAHAEIVKALEAERPDLVPQWQKRLAEIEVAVGGAGFHAVRWDEFLTKDYPPPEPVVNGFLNRGEVALLAAEPKLGKTWLVLDLSLSVGAGLPFLDFATCKGAVIFVNMEMGAGAMQSRARRLAEAKGLTGNAAPEVFFIHALEESPPVKLDTFEARMDRAIDALGLKGQVVLLVLDCYYAIGTGRNEDKSQDVADVVMVFKRIATKHNAAFFLLHHTPKGGGKDRSVNDAARGSSAFAGAVDVVLRLTEEKQDEETRWAKLAGNWRNMEGMPPQLIAFPKHGPPIWTREGEAEPDSGGSVGAPRRFTVSTVTDAFKCDGEILTREEIVKRTGMGRSTASNLLKEAVETGALVRVGQSYALPEGVDDEI